MSPLRTTPPVILLALLAPLGVACGGGDTGVDSGDDPGADGAGGGDGHPDVDGAPDDDDDGGGGDPDGNPPADASPPGGPGHVAFMLGGRAYRVRAESGAALEDVSAALDALSPGDDDAINLSPDGEWMVLDTGRWGCASYTCLAVVRVDMSKGGPIEVDGNVLHTNNVHPAVASGGDLVIYSAAAEHGADLLAVRRSGGTWDTPVVLTGDSPFEFNREPAISENGQKVVFDCGPEPYAVHSSNICEVNTDGTGFRVVIRPEDQGSASDSLHGPDYDPSGGIVFEADWEGEQIWRLAPGASTATLVNDFNNDNTPCVLPDGRIVSLWLNRPGGVGDHELKVMDPGDDDYEMLVTGEDIPDIGIGCGE